LSVISNILLILAVDYDLGNFKDMKSYKELETYKIAFELAIKVQKLCLLLPKMEQYELCSQIRRSSQSVRANIVEGYGRRKYKAEFLRFLIMANASLLETESHLEMLNSLYDKDEIKRLIKAYGELGKKMHRFIEFVQKNWKTENR
jgi:four helix bundle protein